MHEYGIGQHYYVWNVEVADHATTQVVRTLVIALERQSVVLVVVQADEVECPFASVVSSLLHSPR